MYLVVSKWEVASDKKQEFRTGAGRTMRDWLRSRPEVEMVHEFESEDGNALAVIGYKDETSYRKLILDEGGPFVQKMKELKMDSMGKWLWSERGEVVDVGAVA